MAAICAAPIGSSYHAACLGLGRYRLHEPRLCSSSLGDERSAMDTSGHGCFVSWEGLRRLSRMRSA